MSKQTQYDTPEKPRKKKKKGGLLGRIIRRFFLLVFTTIVLLVVALCLAVNLVFKGPSVAARDLLVMTFLEPSATKWIPGLFLDEETVATIKNGEQVDADSSDTVTDTSQVVINKDTSVSAEEWANHPDGIRIEEYAGSTFNSYIMIIRDPSKVYLATSTEKYSTSIPGTRIDDQIETEGAIAGINAGAFLDNGQISDVVGSVPEGLVVSHGQVKWTTGSPPNSSGFAGFNEDDILVVSKENMTKAQAEELKIRDGCCFGPALIINGEVNQEEYNKNSSKQPRTIIGQRADGAVIFLCIDGRQPGAAGATNQEATDIMLEYGAVNACNMDGGSSTIMLYRDQYGHYGETGQVQTISSYSLLQERPRRMPTFWMVAP